MSEELGNSDSVSVDPVEEDVETSFERMIGVLGQVVANRDEITSWIAAWLPLIAAIKSLAATVAKLGFRTRQALGSEDNEALFAEEVLGELQEQFAQLLETFPDASAFFFGVENFDNLVRETVQDEEARAAVGRFGKVVEAKMNALIGRLLDWGLEDGGPELSVERLEAFVRGLEAVLQGALDRWVLPKLYGRFDD